MFWKNCLLAKVLQFIHDGGLYHIDTSRLISRTNQWTGFYMIGTAVMKELSLIYRWNHCQRFLSSQTSDTPRDAETAGVLWRKLFFKISQYSQESTCVEVFFNKVAGLQACTLIKKRLQHRVLPVYVGKWLRAPVLKSICEQLLLHQEKYLNLRRKINSAFSEW